MFPGTFGELISLNVAAFHLTNGQKYLSRANTLADESLNLFWNDGPLPRASSRHDHYEAITRADTLALALVELWAACQTPPRQFALRWADR